MRMVQFGLSVDMRAPDFGVPVRTVYAQAPQMTAGLDPDIGWNDIELFAIQVLPRLGRR
jgi:hypothetical protein